jgi:hypothetical protein
MSREQIYGRRDGSVRPLFSRGWQDRIDLHDLAYEAHKAYRRTARRLRIDLGGDHGHRALTAAKARLVRWFARRRVAW